MSASVSSSPVVVRFAPSPTGFLHIGGARTALFNWLFARHMGGKFLLRIEDTDRARSTREAVEAIFDGLKWLGLDHDEEPVFQFSRIERHQAVAHELLNCGKAYLCYCSPEELEAMKAQATKEGKPPLYDGRWRDRSPEEAPKGVNPVVRLKMPQTGETVIQDLVQGEVRVQNGQLDDMVLLRGDGTPTYMLSVVVDDHDMGITHVIRGNDHLTNGFRQGNLYRAMGWDMPQFAHIPLIHGEDGAKLSKRHGALGVEAYRDMGFLPEAMRNYFLRLGWSHGDDELISTEQAIAWFSLNAIGRSPARFDGAKLRHMNAHYLRHLTDAMLLEKLFPYLQQQHYPETPEGKTRLLKGLPELKERAKTLVELAESAGFYLWEDLPGYDDAAKMLFTELNLALIQAFITSSSDFTENWTAQNLEACARHVAEAQGVKLGQLAQPLRAAVTGKTVSPSLFSILEILGSSLSLKRLHRVMQPV
ncbi:MAG: glutamate--tRNA ligase [Alphaproteobacteria bacterium]